MKNTWVDEVPAAAVLLCNDSRLMEVNVKGQAKNRSIKA
jgi:hypothetical protein